MKNERTILKVSFNFWQIQKNGSPGISVHWAPKCVLPGTLCDTLKRLIVDLKRLKPKVRRNQAGGVVVGEKIPVNSLHHEILENPSLHLPAVTKPIKRKLGKYSGEIPRAQNNWRHLDKEIPFRESEIDCDATKTPGCVADISVSVVDRSF